MTEWKIENKPKADTCNLRLAKNKTKDSQADFRGNLHISADNVKFLVACLKEGKEALLSIQGWDNGIVNRSREGKYGPNIRLVVQAYDESWMEKNPRQQPSPLPQKKVVENIDLDDEIPF